ncbi:MAG TPA: hypothetical protein VKR32_18345 [Puia sp.]|nr:hypothetical protein [Puia sp.]
MYRISTKTRFGAFVLFVLIFAISELPAQNKTATENYFRVENYYKVRWGFAEEFIGLWEKNHYPLLKKAKEKGDIISIVASRPRYHSGEDTRWDFRVTIVFRTVALAFDENLTTTYKKELFPDQDAYAKAEQHRFELLLAHWDIETSDIDLP